MTSRVWRAFLLAPLAAPLAYWSDMVIEAALDASRRSALAGSSLYALALSVLIGGPVAYAATAILGLPLWLATRERGTNPWATIALGALGGVLTAVVLAPELTAELFSIPLGIWRGAALGAITAAVWWTLLP